MSRLDLEYHQQKVDQLLEDASLTDIAVFDLCILLFALHVDGRNAWAAALAET